MNFWKQNADSVLEFKDQKVLKGLGSISNKQMEEKVKEIYVEFNTNRKFVEAKKEDTIELEEIEKLLKNKK
jgi:hypothetical protein